MAAQRVVVHVGLWGGYLPSYSAVYDSKQDAYDSLRIMEVPHRAIKEAMSTGYSEFNEGKEIVEVVPFDPNEHSELLEEY